LIYIRIQHIIESVLPNEQAGFRTNRCTLDEVALLTEDIETSFDKKIKAGGVVLVDLSAVVSMILVLVSWLDVEVNKKTISSK
jgi:hypothetical protein